MPKALRTRRKLLDQQLVTEFAEFRALKNKIEKWLKVQSEDLIPKFKSGFASPLGGPYLLVLGGQDRGNIDWKEEFCKRLKSEAESSGTPPDLAEQLAITKMVEMETAAGKHRVDQVDVKINPSFASKVVSAIVKKLDSRKARGF